MKRLELDNIVKRFGATVAVDGVGLSVEAGEMLAVLGPSGCGKTTLLRLVAGFEEPDSGIIRLGGAEISGPSGHVPPEARHIGMVFQSYALWPHMNVARNAGYALEVAGIKGDEYRRRVRVALDMVGLDAFADRRPAELSGGQRQRVALARCLAMEPSLILLDEPLANLDVHLRAAMQAEFAEFHRKTGATMLYVTHDHGEALALADRIAVMDHGRIVQAAAPRDLYREPATAMVAEFLGQGAVVPARVVSRLGNGDCRAEFLGISAPVRCRAGQAPGTARLCLRPEDLSIDGLDEGFAATVLRRAYRGAETEIEVAPLLAPELRLTLVLADSAAPRIGAAPRIAVRGGWIIPE